MKKLAMITSRQQIHDEAGVGMFMVIIIVMLMMSLCLLVIDLARLELAARSLQRAANASALAAAVELNMSSADDADHWKRSKRAAIAVLKRNPIFAAGTLPDISNPSQQQGSTDPCESGGDYRWQIYDNGKIQIKFERGDYTDSVNGDFQSMEDSTTCSIVSSETTPTAARVTLTAYNISAFFPLFASGKNQISRTGLGVHFD